MTCQRKVVLGKRLTFAVLTHDQYTGVLTDADSLPSYRVYQNENGVTLLAGTMSKLDDANTTGFYVQTIACTAGNRFHAQASYTVHITATMGGDDGGETYGFRVV